MHTLPEVFSPDHSKFSFDFVQEDRIVIRRYYPCMRRNEEVINVRDAVLLKSGPRKKDLPFVARVAAIWEQDEGVCFYHRLKKIISGLCRMHAVTTHHRMKNSLFNPSKQSKQTSLFKLLSLQEALNLKFLCP